MKIVPYQSISGVALGSTCDEVSAVLGKPQSISPATDKKRLEYCYPNITCRFDDQSRMVEATADSEWFEIENALLPGRKRPETTFAELGFVIAKLDESSFSTVGFIVSPRFGIAFDPDCASWVTVFARSELPAWTA